MFKLTEREREKASIKNSNDVATEEVHSAVQFPGGIVCRGVCSLLLRP